MERGMVSQKSTKWLTAKQHCIYSCLLMCCFLNLSIQATETDAAETDLADKTATKHLPLDELRIFAEVYNRIKSTYVEEVDDTTLIKGAIAGMLDSLDPHSRYLDSDAFDDIQDSSSGQYGGLGVQVVPEDGGIKIITPLDNSPAKRAGINAGDMVVKINNSPLRNVKANDAMEMMRGEMGEKIQLTIRREGVDELLEFDLIREIIKLSSIRGLWLGNGIAYVRISQFQRRTGYDLSEAIEKLREQHNGKIKGLILDMRDNPGGVLIAAEAVSNAFLEEGLIVSTRGKIVESNYQFHADKGDVLYGAPIIVLINGGTASAAEIVAGALQDHKRAIILGTRSFGKGSVQTVMPITNNAALKLTTSRYYTPSGRSIQGTGISPDIEIRQREIAAVEEQVSEVYESDLKGSLTNDSLSTSKDDISEEVQRALESDFQLAEALNLLRGISILSLKSN
ncbi:MAG: carboxyl-terminal processing protease [Enterobacterales bacterium]|jgi:carboxyl-terminal processing protease